MTTPPLRADIDPSAGRRPRLKSVKVKGFRSIKEMDLEMRPLNVCIGANGAGKSNLIAFFKLINEMMGRRLQQYVGTTGRATANLYFGPRITRQMEAELGFDVERGTNTYHLRLVHAAGDSLIFADESVSFHAPGHELPQRMSLGAGHQETRIREDSEYDALPNSARSPARSSTPSIPRTSWWSNETAKPRRSRDPTPRNSARGWKTTRSAKYGKRTSSAADRTDAPAPPVRRGPYGTEWDAAAGEKLSPRQPSG